MALVHISRSSVGVDGDTLIAGAPELDPLGGNGRGAVYLFDRSGSTWTEHDRFLLAPAVLRHFGTSVAMSGNSFIGGAPFDTVGSNLGQGSAYVFSTGHTLSIADVSVAEAIAALLRRPSLSRFQPPTPIPSSLITQLRTAPRMRVRITSLPPGRSRSIPVKRAKSSAFL